MVSWLNCDQLPLMRKVTSSEWRCYIRIVSPCSALCRSSVCWHDCPAMTCSPLQCSYRSKIIFCRNTEKMGQGETCLLTVWWHICVNALMSPVQCRSTTQCLLCSILCLLPNKITGSKNFMYATTWMSRDNGICLMWKKSAFPLVPTFKLIEREKNKYLFDMVWTSWSNNISWIDSLIIG